MSNLFTQISEAARRQQEQLERARSDNQPAPPVQPAPDGPPPAPSEQIEAKSNSQRSTKAVPSPHTLPAATTKTPITKPKSSSKAAKQKPNGRTGKPNGKAKRAKTASKPQSPLAEPILPTSISLDSLPHGVMDEMADGMNPDAKRSTERYSFEIYTDQKHLIRQLQMAYEYRTGKPLPKSRIIREALDAYLNLALKEAA